MRCGCPQEPPRSRHRQRHHDGGSQIREQPRGHRKHEDLAQEKTDANMWLWSPPGFTGPPSTQPSEEKGFHVVLANAYHVRSIPGRVTDTTSSQWLAQAPSRSGLV
ncbi:MAG: hypothetical protein QXR19_14255 [Candidatus Jordarchaeaceae archaeon]